LKWRRALRDIRAPTMGCCEPCQLFKESVGNHGFTRFGSYFIHFA
jgi:hypothetical protein